MDSQIQFTCSIAGGGPHPFQLLCGQRHDPVHPCTKLPGHLDLEIISSGTLGKVYGNIGGYVAASSYGAGKLKLTVHSQDSNNTIIISGFIFMTSLTPTVLAWSLASVRILRSEEGRQLRSRHKANVRPCPALCDSRFRNF